MWYVEWKPEIKHFRGFIMIPRNVKLANRHAGNFGMYKFQAGLEAIFEPIFMVSFLDFHGFSAPKLLPVINWNFKSLQITFAKF